MTITEKLYLCLCIRHNRFRYSAFGREADRTLGTLPVPCPDEFPSWITTVSLVALDHDHSSPQNPGVGAAINLGDWRSFRLSDLFELKKGARLTKASAEPGETAFISAIDSNNGLRQRVSAKPMHKGGTITVNYNGIVAEAFYQPEPFFASDDVNVLFPKFLISEFVALFICTVIRREKYRFNYSRKWNLEGMRDSQIMLPAKAGLPGWAEMHSFIGSLPYSSAVAQDLEQALSIQRP